MLRNTALAGVGVWLSADGLATTAASPNEKIDIACIGIGGRGRANVGGVKGENIVALCDVDDQKAGDAYGKFPRARKFYDFRRLFDDMEKAIDAVVVSTPDHTHFHPSMMALERGKHLYCEKPMAHSVYECRAMTELAREKKLATQLGCQRHALDNVHRVVEIIRSGAIGEVTDVHAWVGGKRGMPTAPDKFPPVPSHLKWDLWLGPAAERPYSPEFAPYKWRFWWDFGTGETGNWGCHILDIPFWALELVHPTRVRASGPERDEQRTPRSMETHFDFPATEKRPAVKLHWSHTAKGPDILREYGMPHFGSGVVFVGKKGQLLCDFGKRKLFPQEEFKGFVEPERSVPDSPGFYREWFRAIRGGEPATCHFDYSGPMAETVLLGNVAYRVGGGFEWDAETLAASGAPVDAYQWLAPGFRKGWERELPEKPTVAAG